MLLLIPLGPEAETPRLPRLTAVLIVLNALVFLFTSGSDVRGLAEEEARLERIAAFTLGPVLRDRPDLAARRAPHSSVLAFLSRETGWAQAVSDPEARERLQRCVEDYRKLTSAHPFYRYGFVPAEVTPARLVTHMFIHADALHLCFNMLFLWAVGGLLETTLGWPLFATLYLLSGIAAALSHAASHPASAEPAVGASGAVAGLMGLFAVVHAREPMRLALVSMLAIAPRVSFFSLPAVVFLGAWVLEQVFWALMTTSVDVGIAFWAHLGGFALGALAGAGVRGGLLPALRP